MNIQAVLTDSKTDGKFKSYIGYKLKSARTRLIMNVIFAVLSFPAGAIAISLFSYYEDLRKITGFMEKNALEEIATVLGVLCIVALAGITLLTFLNGVLGFDYYYKRSVVDMNYSLPLTRKQRFWGDFSVGIAPVLLLYVASAIVGLVILFFVQPSALQSENYSGWGLIIGGLITGLVFLFFLYSMVVFCTSLSGRFFEAAVYPFILSGLIPSVISIIFYILFNHPALNYDNVLVDILICTSPMGLLFGSFSYMNVSYISLLSMPVFKPHIIIPVILLTALYITSSFYSAKKRVTERVGLPFVYKITYHIYLCAIIFCITALFTYIAGVEYFSISVFLAMVITTALTFLVIEVITNRGFKKMHIALLRYIITVGASLLFGLILTSLDSFKLYKYVPDIDKVESVRIYCYQNFSQNESVVSSLITNDSSDELVYYSYRRGVEFDEPENIESIIRIHSETNYDDVDYYQNTFITYKMKNGKKVSRNIFLKKGQPYETIADLYHSREYKEQELEALDILANYPTEPNQRFEVNLTEAAAARGFPLTETEAKELLEAFKTDYAVDRNDEDKGDYLGSVEFSCQVYSGTGDRYYTGEIMRFSIFGGYENTVEFLKGTDFPTSPDYSRYLSMPIILYNNSEYNDEYAVIQSQKYNNGVYSESSWDMPVPVNQAEIPAGWDKDERVLTLLKKSIPVSYREPNYSIYFSISFGGSYETRIVPDYLNSLAKEVFEDYVQDTIDSYQSYAQTEKWQ